MKLSQKILEALDDHIEEGDIDLDELAEYVEGLTSNLYQMELISFRISSIWTETDGHYLQAYIPLPALNYIRLSFTFNTGYDGVLNFNSIQELIQSLLILERQAVLVIDTYNLSAPGGRYRR